MLTLAALLVPPALAVDPIRIRVDDPTVREVTLECENARKLTAPVRQGMASFAENPGKCKVLFLAEAGQISGPAEYTCSAQGCQKNDVVHRTVGAADGRVVIVITDNSASLLELKCTTYQERARVETNTAVFDGVPAGEECALLWKGGTGMARANKLSPGHWSCHTSSNTGICVRR